MLNYYLTIITIIPFILTLFPFTHTHCLKFINLIHIYFLILFIQFEIGKFLFDALFHFHLTWSEYCQIISNNFHTYPYILAIIFPNLIIQEHCYFFPNWINLWFLMLM